MPESTDGFVSLTLRASRGSSSASSDFSECLHFGDAVVLTVTGVQGIDADTAMMALTTPESPYTAVSALLYSVLPAVKFVQGRKDAVYCTVSLLTDEAKALAALGTPGNPARARVYVADASRTWVDTSVALLPSPLLDGLVAPVAGDPYVPASKIAAIGTAMSQMATATPAQREARVNYLIAQFIALGIPPP